MEDPSTAGRLPARTTRGVIDVAGRKRTYTFITPSAATADSLVLVFHGSNQTAGKFRTFSGDSFAVLAETGGAILAYLDGYKGHWNDARLSASFAARTENVDDVAFAKVVINELTADHGGDALKVYAVGFSNGGQMVIRLIHEIPELLTGAAIISATQPAPGNFAGTGKDAVALPVLLIHGTRDPIVPYGGGMASLWGFRPRGLGLSAPETAAYFAARNGITDPPVTTDLPHRKDSGKTRATRTDYQQTGKPPVTLYTIEGGGHIVPNHRKAPAIMGRSTHALVAADAIGEFFGLSSHVQLTQSSDTRGLTWRLPRRRRSCWMRAPTWGRCPRSTGCCARRERPPSRAAE